MEFESTEQMQMVCETLNNIDTAITRLQERTVQIHTVDDFLLSPFGMEKLDAACMVIIALGEAVKTLDKLTENYCPLILPLTGRKSWEHATSWLIIILRLMLTKFSVSSRTT